MAKKRCVIGFIFPEVETPEGSGIWKPASKEERYYYVEIIKNNRQYQAGEGINDNLLVKNRFSIIADPYAAKNFFAMKFIEWQGTRWKISDISVEYPRLILEIGGVWNG